VSNNGIRNRLEEFFSRTNDSNEQSNTVNSNMSNEVHYREPNIQNEIQELNSLNRVSNVLSTSRSIIEQHLQNLIARRTNMNSVNNNDSNNARPNVPRIEENSNRVSINKTIQDDSTFQLDRVLIVGLSNNYETRSMYEKELSFRLREMGFNMFSSVNVDPQNRKLFTKEEIIELIEEKNIDGIITMRLKNIKSEEKYTKSDRYISDMYNWHNYFFNYIDTYYNVYSWSYQPKQTVVVEANLFDADSKRLIFQVDATISNVDSEEERAAELTQSFANSLNKSGFLKKKAF
jgi:hypothetical protein